MSYLILHFFVLLLNCNRRNLLTKIIRGSIIVYDLIYNLSIKPNNKCYYTNRKKIGCIILILMITTAVKGNFLTEFRMYFSKEINTQKTTDNKPDKN